MSTADHLRQARALPTTWDEARRVGSFVLCDCYDCYWARDSAWAGNPEGIGPLARIGATPERKERAFPGHSVWCCCSDCKASDRASAGSEAGK